MSSCGSCSTGCKCGSGCGCNSCGCCKAGESIATTQTMTLSVAPPKGQIEGFESAENGGCKCGSNCTCDPCTCK